MNKSMSFALAVCSLLALSCVAEAHPVRTTRDRVIVVHDVPVQVQRTIVLAPATVVQQTVPSYSYSYATPAQPAQAEQIQALPKVESVTAAPAPTVQVQYVPVQVPPTFFSTVTSSTGYYQGTVSGSRVVFFRDRTGRVFRVHSR